MWMHGQCSAKFLSSIYVWYLRIWSGSQLFRKSSVYKIIYYHQPLVHPHGSRFTYKSVLDWYTLPEDRWAKVLRAVSFLSAPLPVAQECFCTPTWITRWPLNHLHRRQENHKTFINRPLSPFLFPKGTQKRACSLKTHSIFFHSRTPTLDTLKI